MYIHCMRLIDLLIVTVIYEVNQVSRYVKWDLVNIGIARSIFLLCLSCSYYVIYRILIKKLNGLIILKENSVVLWGGYLWV